MNLMLIFFSLLITAIMHLFCISSMNSSKLEFVSLTWSLMILTYYNVFMILFNKSIDFQLLTQYYWMDKSFNLNWGKMMFSVDGLSLFFMGLSMLLIPICMMMSSKAMNHLKKEFLMSLFIILILLIGVFTTMDMVIFYILFEGILIPMFLMIGMWGSSEEKMKAAFYFFFYTLMGSLLMLMSMFKMYALTGTTNYLELLHMHIPNQTQWWLFLGFLASLAVKMPMMPSHIWLPQAHVEAPVAGSVLLAGILLKLGGYGFMSFSFPLFSNASNYFAPIMIILSLMAIMYASFTTCSQTDIKSLIAYSSVAHMGLVTLAMFTHSMEGLIASVVMMLAHGLISSALFMSSAILYVSHHSSAMSYFSGLVITMPLFSSLSLILILSNMGFPLTFNFMAEFFSILTAFNYSYMTGMISSIGALLSTVYALYFYNRMYFGTLSIHLMNSSEILDFEFQAFIPLVVLTLILGILPNSLFSFLMQSSYTNISL